MIVCMLVLIAGANQLLDRAGLDLKQEFHIYIYIYILLGCVCSFLSSLFLSFLFVLLENDMSSNKEKPMDDYMFI